MIILPMAGRSSRFFKAGYKVPKYQLPVTKDYCVFECILLCFKKYFSHETFLIICLRDDSQFVENILKNIGIKKYVLSCLDEVTRGQAETVYLGLKNNKLPHDEPILIFNIDTFRPGYQFPDFSMECDGFLEVFRGDGDNWSYAKLDQDGYVSETTEKVRISDLCSTGGYFFRKASSFLEAFEKCVEGEATVKGEYYIAPLYNYLVEKGMKIKVDIIQREDVIFCGIPSEYEELDIQKLSNKLGIPPKE